MPPGIGVTEWAGMVKIPTVRLHEIPLSRTAIDCMLAVVRALSKDEVLILIDDIEGGGPDAGPWPRVMGSDG